MDALRVGILAEERSAVFSWDATKSAMVDAGVEIVYFVEKPVNRYRRRWRDLPARVALRLLARCEGWIAGYRQAWFEVADAIPLSCIFKGHFKEFSDQDIRRIRDTGVDLIVRLGGRGIYRGEILEATPHGIISIHHGDNRLYRGGPPVFWELLKGETRTGYVIQRLTSTLDGGQIIARGGIPTPKYMQLGRKHLFAAADNALRDVVLSFALNRCLPNPEPPLNALGPIYRMPRFVDLMKYVWVVWLVGR